MVKKFNTIISFRKVEINRENKHLYRGEAALCKHLREHDQKAALSSEKRESRNKPRISKNSATCRIRICDLLQSRDFESDALSPQPRKLNNRQRLVTNKAATYAYKLSMQFIKSDTKYNITQFCK